MIDFKNFIIYFDNEISKKAAGLFADEISSRTGAIPAFCSEKENSNFHDFHLLTLCSQNYENYFHFAF